MTTEIVTFPLEIAEADFSDGALTVRCVPYNQVSFKRPNPKGERFLTGAFTRNLQARGPGKIRLTDSHLDGKARRPYGVATAFEETADALYGTFRFYDTPAGREGREEAKAGTYGGVSIGWATLKDRYDADGVREIIEARLHHVSLVDEPAYDGAEVLAVADPHDTRSPFMDWTPPEIIDIPNVHSV